MNLDRKGVLTPGAKRWLAGLCVLFVAARVWGLFTDFWLDEIWALDVVGRIASPLDVFTRVHFDTNHWLYSLLLFGIGPREGWIAYRLPALAAGVASLPLVFAIARREGELAGGIGLLLAGSSFLLIEYSSEARGYALAVFFALGAFHALRRFFESGRASWCVAFNVCCALGLLSHLTFLFPYAGFLAWSIAEGLTRPFRPVAACRRIASCHAVPVLLYLALYLVDIRHIQHGGGPETSLAAVIGRLSALTLGLPDAPLLPQVAIALCAGIAAIGAWQLWKSGSREWVFYAVTLLVSPACIVMARAQDFPYWTERHFLVCVPFLLLLLTVVLARVADSGRVGRAAAFSLLALYLAGNSVRTLEFLRFGRGHYRDAVEYIFAHSSASDVSVGSDHDFRNGMLLTYYGRYAPPGRRLVYFSGDGWPREGPQWLIIHSTDESHVASPQHIVDGRIKYVLSKQFPFSGVSGWHWDLYLRAD